MANKNDESIKFPVGKFSITDENYALVFSAKIEIGKGFIEPFILLSAYPFDKEKASISMSFSAIELRTFANNLTVIYYDASQSYTKHTGGHTHNSNVKVSMIERYASLEFSSSAKKCAFRIDRSLLEGLSQQIIHLIETTMDACYKTQQFEHRKKLDAAKALPNNQN